MFEGSRKEMIKVLDGKDKNILRSVSEDFDDFHISMIDIIIYILDSKLLMLFINLFFCFFYYIVSV